MKNNSHIISFLTVTMTISVLLIGCSKNNKIVVSKAEEQIAFVSHRDGNTEIYVMDLEGKNQRNITNNPARDGAPAFSPDGTQIVFSSERDGNTEIYVMNSDGSNVNRLTDSLSIDTVPNWSSDGKKIVFLSDRDNMTMDNVVSSSEVYMMNINGSEQTRLTNDYDFDHSPSWVSDEIHVLLSSSIRGVSGAYSPGEIYILNTTTSQKEQLTPYGYFGYSPTFSPVNNHIA